MAKKWGPDNIKRKYCDIKQVSLIFSKESNNVPTAFHTLLLSKGS